MIHYTRSRGVSAVVAGSTALPFPDDHFDLIIMKHSLEHMPDPIATVTEAWRVMKPGGKIVIEVPNGCSTSARLLGSAWSGIDAPRHLFLFSSSSLRNTLIKSGFHMLRINKKTMALCIRLTKSNMDIKLKHASINTMTRTMNILLMRLLIPILKFGLTRDIILIKGVKPIL